MSLNQVRFQSLFDGMSAVAQKVYEAVPKSESWHYTAIHKELVRLGTGRDLTVARGCLKSLSDSGLVHEPERNHFVRIPVREQQMKPPRPEPINTKTEEPKMAEQPKAKADACAKIESLAAEVIKAASNMKRIASELETALLEVHELLQEKDSKMVKLNQLQSLLKELA